MERDNIISEIEEKGANFLYLIVKNHVFADGNKRIAMNNMLDIKYKMREYNIDRNSVT